MNAADFQFLRTFLQVHTGMALGNDGLYLADSRLPAVCRRFALPDAEALVAMLRAGRHFDVERAVIEAMVTQETSFFRDKAIFKQLHEVVLPALIEARSSRRRLRIWSAAASTGQEAYSLAILLDNLAPQLIGWTVDLVATDLSEAALERGRAGLYSHFEVQRGLPIQLLIDHFTQDGDAWQISPALRSKVVFAPVNLMDDFTGLGAFDLILCRNVLIYFDEATKRHVLERVVDRLAADGKLVLGGVETPAGLTEAVVSEPGLKGIYCRNPTGGGRGELGAGDLSPPNHAPGMTTSAGGEGEIA